MRLILQPNADFRLGDHLAAQFADTNWDTFRAAVAFVKQSGTRHIKDALRAFAQRAKVVIAVGIDCRVTSREGLLDLLNAVGKSGDVFIFHNEQESTFHPKMYVFRGKNHASLAVGSGNLTRGGLFVNYEATLVVHLDLTLEPDRLLLAEAEAELAAWSDPVNPTVKRLDTRLLEQLVREGYVPSEALSVPADDPVTPPLAASVKAAATRLFGRVAVRRAPAAPAGAKARAPAPGVVAIPSRKKPAPVPMPAVAVSGFVMTLMQTDAGHGQKTAGKQRRSPEVFIPLAARDAAPAFWGWPASFTKSLTKLDRKGVRMRIGTQVVKVNMMVWKAKHDLRLRSEVLRSAGAVNDILRLVKTDSAAVGYEYEAEIIRQGSPAYPSHFALCDHQVQNSSKRWGSF